MSPLKLNQGLPTNLKIVKSRSEEVSFTCQNNEYLLTVEKIKAGQLIGTGGEGEVYRFSAYRRCWVEKYRPITVVAKIKKIDENAAGYASLFNEIIIQCVGFKQTGPHGQSYRLLFRYKRT